MAEGLLASATTSASTTHLSTVADVSVGHVLFQMVIALVVIVGAIWGFGKFVAYSRTHKLTRTGSVANTGALTVLSRQSLGKEHHLAVVRWGEREVLVGIAGSNITFLNADALPDAKGEETELDLHDDTTLQSTLRSSLMSSLWSTPRNSTASNSGSSSHSLLESLREATTRN
jgi:flagellar biogenesis protein FliO